MRNVLMLALIVLGLPLAAAAQEQKAPADRWMRAGYVALGAVSFADIETTGRCLATLGCREANPIYKPFAGTPGAVGLVNGGISAGVGLGTYALHKRGKRREARIVVWTWTIVRAAVVAHNIRQVGRR